MEDMTGKCQSSSQTCKTQEEIVKHKGLHTQIHLTLVFFVDCAVLGRMRATTHACLYIVVVRTCREWTVITLTWDSGPELAILVIVLGPIAETICANLLTYTSVKCKCCQNIA